MNLIALNGRLTQDVKIGQYKDNHTLSGSVAVNRYINGKDDVDFFNFSKISDKPFTPQYLKLLQKGAMVSIIGNVRVSTVVDEVKNEKRKYWTIYANKLSPILIGQSDVDRFILHQQENHQFKLPE